MILTASAVGKVGCADIKVSFFYAHPANGENGIIKLIYMDNYMSSEQVGMPAPTAPGASEPITSPPSMWFGFLYVILFKTLYVSAIALAGLLNHAVNEFIPDALTKSGFSYYYWNYGDYFLKGYLASIIVAFPILAIVFLILKRKESIEPRIREFRLRIVLIYITLTITFTIMLSNVISVVYKFLGGEATLRALAHLGVTLLISGSIFLYFILDARSKKRSV